MTETQYDTNLIAQLFDVQPDAVIWFYPVFDGDRDDVITDWEIRYCNSSTAKVLKAGVNEIIGSHVGKSALFDTATKKLIMQQCESVWTSGEPLELMFHNTTVNRHFNIQRSKVLNGILTIARDRTREMESERESQNQAEQLKSIMDASLNGVFACEAIRDDENKVVDLKIIRINKAFSRILGLQESDVLQKRYSDVFPGSKGSDLVELHAEVIETGKPIQTEKYYRDKNIDGWFIISISKWGTNGVVNTFQDCTALKQLQHQLELTIQGLQRSNQRLTEFTYVASHDLNEPLRKVATFSKLLTQRLGEDLDPGAKDYLLRIEKTIQRMQVLLDNLLIYSRVSKQINRFEPIQLNEIINEVLTDLEIPITQKKATIQIDNLPVITGDRTQLRQLFQNVISNALKFQHADSTPSILIHHRETNGEMSMSRKTYDVIEVSDNGIGFDQAESEKIFQLFHRLHARHEFEGTGIGLAIVQRAIENHHGFIEVRSEPGKGAKFSFFFPKNS